MRKTPILVLSLCAVLGTGAALAQSQTTTLAPVLAAASAQHAGHHQDGRKARRAALALRVAADPTLAAIAQLRAMERIHRREQQPAAIDAMYQDILARSNNLTLRNFASFRLAKLAMREQDAAAALKELRRGLEENLQKAQ